MTSFLETILERYSQSDSATKDDTFDDAGYNHHTNTKHQIVECEKNVQKDPYNVSTWITYFEIVDEILESIIQQQQQLQQQQRTAGSSNNTRRTRNDHHQQTQTEHMMVLLLLWTWIDFRDEIGRRAVQLLPKSYKLWKLVWEFLINHLQKEQTATMYLIEKQTQPQQQRHQLKNNIDDNDHSIDVGILLRQRQERIIQVQNRILSCFEQALITLSPYPRVWMVYMMWWMKQYNEIVIKVIQKNIKKKKKELQDDEEEEEPVENYQQQHDDNDNDDSGMFHHSYPIASCCTKKLLSITHFRRILNRSLIALHVFQHDKIWSIVVDWLYEYDCYDDSNNNDNDNDDDKEEDDDIDDNHNNDETNNDTTSITKKIQLIPIETTYRILYRYTRIPETTITLVNDDSSKNNNTYHNNKLLRFAQWCTKYGKYTAAAKAYMILLSIPINNNNDAKNETKNRMNNNNNNATTTTTSNSLMSIDRINNSELYYQCWTYFCELITQHSISIEHDGIPWEHILRSAIKKQLQPSSSTTSPEQPNEEPPNEQSSVVLVSTTNNNSRSNSSSTTTTNQFMLLGLLYTQLANAWIVRNQYDKARSVYEEGISIVCTVRDFSILYASYLQLEENIITMLSLSIDDETNNNNDDDNDNENENDNDDNEQQSLSLLTELENAIVRTEQLTNRRPLLLNAVQLRQEPTNVNAWLERSNLYLQQQDEQPEHEQQESTTTNSNSNSSSVENAIQALMDGLQAITDATTTVSSAATTTTTTSSNNDDDDDAIKNQATTIVIPKNNNHNNKTTFPIAPLVQRLVEIYETTTTATTNDTNTTTTSTSTTDMMISKAQHVMECICLKKQYHVASIDDGTNCWTIWIEFVLRYDLYDLALSLSRQAIHSTMKSQSTHQLSSTTSSSTTNKYKKKNNTNNNNNNNNNSIIYMNKSIRLWDLVLDMEENFGTVQTTKDMYEQVITTKIVTIQQLLNYGMFLTQNEYYEESYTIYEQGIEELFSNHNGIEVIWKVYIQSFLKRYGGTKIERTRSLFERCLEQMTTMTITNKRHPDRNNDDSNNDHHDSMIQCMIEFYVLYGTFEEQYGLTKRVLTVYRDLCHYVIKAITKTRTTTPTTNIDNNDINNPSQQQQKKQNNIVYMSYKLFVLKTRKYHGMIATRDIYQEALESLSSTIAASSRNNHTKHILVNALCWLCIDFATMEANTFHEMDRSRAIYVYGSSYAATTTAMHSHEYWNQWKQYEIQYGTEDTFREMLRTKRHVEAIAGTNTTTTLTSTNANTAFVSPTTTTTTTMAAPLQQQQPPPLSDEEAIRMIAATEGVDVPVLTGFVPASSSTTTPGMKRSATTATSTTTTLDDIEERVAKIRKVTNTIVPKNDDHNDHDDDNDEEINIEEIDAEIEQAAAAGGDSS